MLHHTPQKALNLSLVVTIIFFFVELTGGFLTNSLALLSDAAHMLTHMFALFIAWGALRISCRMPSDRRTFGFHRIEVFSALINGLVLVGFGVVIFYSAFLKFQHPTFVYSREMLFIAVLGLIANLYVASKLYGFSDINIRGAFLHVLGDTLSSILVIIGAVWMIFTEQFVADALLSMVIAIIIVVSSFKLIWESLHILLEGTPKHIDINEVIKEVKKVKKVKDIHAIHIWSLCSHVNVMSAHILVDATKIGNTYGIIQELNKRLKKFEINHTTFQFECVKCATFTKLKEIRH